MLATAHWSALDHAQALTTLDRALALAEPEGYVRVFTAHGEPMVALVRARLRSAPAPTYARQLLLAASRPRSAPGGEGRSGSWTPGGASHESLVDPSSDRERDVMRLLASDLDGPAIARELVVSLSTVRTHTKNIYASSVSTIAVRRYAGLTLTANDDGTTVLRGPVIDQAALHGLLQRLRDLGLPLISALPVHHDPVPSPAALDSQHPNNGDPS